MNRRTVALFYVVACAVSWLIAISHRLAVGPLEGGSGMVAAVLFMFGPALAAWLVDRRVNGPEGLGARLGVRFNFNRWWFVASLLPVALAIAITGFGLLLPWTSLDLEMTGMFERFADRLTAEQLAAMKEQVRTLPVHPIFLAMLQGILAGLTINAVAAFGEELGWRGLLFRETAPLGFWRASMITGVLWGVWHAPMILQGHNYPQHPVAGVAMMTVFTLLLSPLMHLVRLRTGSVLAAAVMHGTLNAVAGAALMIVKGGDDLTAGPTGIPGLAVLAIADVALLIALRLRPQWAEPVGVEVR